MVIHSSSMHPFSHKLAAFRSYIHRLVNVPMSQENFQVELNIIKQIAINNGYIPHLIDKMVVKKLLTSNSVRISTLCKPASSKISRTYLYW